MNLDKAYQPDQRTESTKPVSIQGTIRFLDRRKPPVCFDMISFQTKKNKSQSPLSSRLSQSGAILGPGGYSRVKGYRVVKDIVGKESVAESEYAAK